MAVSEYVKKKKFQKNVKIIKENNTSGIEILEHIKKTSSLPFKERTALSDLQAHLERMNVLFSDMEKGS